MLAQRNAKRVLFYTHFVGRATTRCPRVLEDLCLDKRTKRTQGSRFEVEEQSVGNERKELITQRCGKTVGDFSLIGGGFVERLLLG
jgi:hypothetical protein